jgi:hypothetical protein
MLSGPHSTQSRSPVAVRLWAFACLWVVLGLLLIFVRGKNLSLDRNVTDRLRFHAIPVAASVLYHGRPHDFTAYQSMARHFQMPTLTADELIPWGAVGFVPPGDATYYWAADDRGMADYVIGAFALFGPATESLYNFYFVVLAMSCGFALVGYWRHRLMTAVWLFSLAGIYCCLSIMPLATLSGSMWEPPSLFEPRTLELLAFIASLHIAFAGWFTERWTIAAGLALAGQVIVFWLCYHARSSLGWEALFIVAVNLAAVSGWFRRERGQRVPRALARPMAWVPLVMFVCGLGALNLYKHATYHPRYFADMGARTFWHNALMGLESNARLGAKYHLGISDSAAIEAVIADMRANGDPRLTAQWTNENIRNSLGGWFEFNWYEYESAARALYFRIWRQDFLQMVRCYVFDKPLGVASQIIHAWLPDGHAQRKLRGLYFNPLGLVPLFIGVPGIILLLLARSDRVGTLIPPLLFLLLCSLIPGMLFYSVVLTMMGTFAAITVLVYVIGAMALQRLTLFVRTPLKTEARMTAS